MESVISGGLLFLGAFFVLVASIGLVRMPDLFLRMSSSTKAAALGVGTMMAAVAMHFGDLGVTTRAFAIVAFVLLTAPVAAHMIGRAAYFIGVMLADTTLMDELHGRYDLDTHVLSGHDQLRNGGSG